MVCSYHCGELVYIAKTNLDCKYYPPQSSANIVEIVKNDNTLEIKEHEPYLDKITKSLNGQIYILDIWYLDLNVSTHVTKEKEICKNIIVEICKT